MSKIYPDRRIMLRADPKSFLCEGERFPGATVFKIVLGNSSKTIYKFLYFNFPGGSGWFKF